VEAVRQWRFDPTLLNGEAVEVVMTVSVRFSLAD
jgi:outer membrane biosynthesis protein TonB